MNAPVMVPLNGETDPLEVGRGGPCSLLLLQLAWPGWGGLLLMARGMSWVATLAWLLTGAQAWFKGTRVRGVSSTLHVYSVKYRLP